MKNKITFLIEYIRNLRTTGSFIPSQRFLIRTLIQKVNSRTPCVIELGAGEGCITRALETHVEADTLILSFEINEKLIKLSKHIRKNTCMIHDRAEEMKKYIDIHKVTKVEYIISSLPLGSLKKEIVDDILNVVTKNLIPGGKFIQYQYLPLNRSDLKKHFSKVETTFVLMNIPPAFVYTCEK